jgi:hypothetical protein
MGSDVYAQGSAYFNPEYWPYAVTTTDSVSPFIGPVSTPFKKPSAPVAGASWR